MGPADYFKDFVVDGGQALPAEPHPWGMSWTSRSGICLLPQGALHGDQTCDGAAVELYGLSDRLLDGEAPLWLGR